MRILKLIYQDYEKLFQGPALPFATTFILRERERERERGGASGQSELAAITNSVSSLAKVRSQPPPCLHQCLVPPHILLPELACDQGGSKTHFTEI